MMRRLFGCALAALPLVGAAPAPPAASPVPGISAMKFPAAASTALGAGRLLVENDAAAQLAGAQIFVGAGLARQSANSAGVAAVAAECVLRTPVDGVPLREAVAAAGGSLQYTVDARSTHFYLEGIADRMPALAVLVARAFAAPDFSAATVAASRSLLAARAADSDGNAIATGIAMFRRSYYMGPAGLPALGSRATLMNLAPSDVADFFRVNYRRGSATVSVVGNVVPAFAPAAEKIVAALPDGAVSQAPIKTNPISAQTTRIVARRDIGAPTVVVGFAAADPGSDDYGAMLILEALLSQAFEDPSTTTLGFRERSLGAFYLYDALPASMVFYVNGNRADPSIALRALLGVAQSLAKRPLAAAVLARYKAAAVGSFVNDTVTLSDRAYMLGVLSGAGFGSDPINAALAAVQRASSADVERAAKRYLQRYIVALVLPRQAPAGS